MLHSSCIPQLSAAFSCTLLAYFANQQHHLLHKLVPASFKLVHNFLIWPMPREPGSLCTSAADIQPLAIPVCRCIADLWHEFLYWTRFQIQSIELGETFVPGRVIAVFVFQNVFQVFFISLLKAAILSCMLESIVLRIVPSVVLDAIVMRFFPFVQELYTVLRQKTQAKNSKST